MWIVLPNVAVQYLYISEEANSRQLRIFFAFKHINFPWRKIHIVMCIYVFNYYLAACPEIHVTNVTNDLVNPSNYLFHGEYLIRGIFFTLCFCRSTWTARWCKKCAVLPEPRYCTCTLYVSSCEKKKILLRTWSCFPHSVGTQQICNLLSVKFSQSFSQKCT
jgi:hypothetical protein